MSERTRKASRRVRSYYIPGTCREKYMSYLDPVSGFPETQSFQYRSITRWAAKLCFSYLERYSVDYTIGEAKNLLERYARVLDNWSTIGDIDARYMYSVAKDVCMDIWDWYDGMEFTSVERIETC